VGVTVSGGKDSLYAWLWLVDHLGPDRVIAFNHDKLGMVHPLAERNLAAASEALGSELIRVQDLGFAPRFQANLKALLLKPDPAMVRVALCAGCRFGITGALFTAGRDRGITKFVNAASYLELAPFKPALMLAKGEGSERHGLLRGLSENAAYEHSDNHAVIMRDDDHCHETQLSNGAAAARYPGVQYFDFDEYLPNVPNHSESVVRQRLKWSRPARSWHFDCQVEVFKDVFYYGLLGYTETDNHLSALVRHGLASREEAVNRLEEARDLIIHGLPAVLSLMDELGTGDLQSVMTSFYDESPFLVAS